MLEQNTENINWFPEHIKHGRFEKTVEQAKLRGCAEYGLYLVETTEQNLPFYEKYGFKKVGSELRQSLRSEYCQNR